MTANSKPTYEKRLGHIRLAIWKNPIRDNGGNFRDSNRRTWYNISIARSFKVGDEWREASTFNGLADLAVVAECVELARAWILKSEDRA